MLKTLLKTALQIPNPSSMIVALRRLRLVVQFHSSAPHFQLNAHRCRTIHHATLLKTLLKTFGIC